jgi:hypothetical protein
MMWEFPGALVPLASRMLAQFSEVDWQELGLSVFAASLVIYLLVKWIPAQQKAYQDHIDSVVNLITTQLEEDRAARKEEQRALERIVRQMLMALAKAGASLPDKIED